MNNNRKLGERLSEIKDVQFVLLAFLHRPLKPSIKKRGQYLLNDAIGLITSKTYKLNCFFCLYCLTPLNYKTNWIVDLISGGDDLRDKRSLVVALFSFETALFRRLRMLYSCFLCIFFLLSQKKEKRREEEKK